ncbi:PREDICTED: uncharacterized protein LOC105313243 [Amphimedon queenslandica]|uniref:Uncharacterized protein n=1 Tax=Amphimedon queenslandica TaxID=400682 RepID=A0A1X7UKU7_AMPQE|nr:PREDICTED: uncharacterized protein LOC105313243 [Amphimedon queenslandica]|eukprot:XP_011404819.1 PREDICTED: uncharacterized protein LOC105313243 [Amphimedon queenslandica]
MKVATIANFLEISPSTVKRYINKFYRTGDVNGERKRNGPTQLLGDFEQAVLLRMISNHPGIYLHEIQSKLLNKFGVIVSLATICQSLRYLGCTKQYMHHIALQQSEVLRSKFMAEISLYDPSMLIWIDESGCDRSNTIRKYGYSLKGHPLNDCHLLVRGIRYSVIPIISMNGILDLYITSGTINGEKFINFIRYYFMPLLKPFNYSNEHSV